MAIRDAGDIYHYSKDPQVAQHVLWDAHESIHQTRAYIRYVLRQYKNGEPSSFAIEEKASHRVIGTIGYMWLNQENRSGEVGYSLSRAHWNRGYMTEALKAVIDFGFEVLLLNRIEAQHETANPASGRVMAKAGMQKEGVLRSRIFNKGKYVDVALYAILHDQWVKNPLP
ncbi:MAG: GNAT family N-acetyltransferase [Clostridia bacterium]|nr:GNAT family N-acetyltransferase [Clostridia bacterium]